MPVSAIKNQSSESLSDFSWSRSQNSNYSEYVTPNPVFLAALSALLKKPNLRKEGWPLRYV